jgi:chemotaxis protein CheY-P-specific phosphatase CheC
MLDGQERITKQALKKAFESGYSNAVASLSKIINKKIYFNNFYEKYQKTDSIHIITDQTLHYRSRENLLITTEIFGDVTGKSYLLLSEEELELLTVGIPQHKEPHLNLKEEFLKEVDNILSASVITRLSNELKIKMYGDIPIVVGNVSGKIEDILYDDFQEQNEVYTNAIFFSFEHYPLISPLFIWVMVGSILSVGESKTMK